MTKSVTPAGLPRAGANSKPHHYKQTVQKMKDLPRSWVLTGKQFEDFRREKRTETLFSTGPLKKNKWNTRTVKASIEHGPRRQ